MYFLYSNTLHNNNKTTEQHIHLNESSGVTSFGETPISIITRNYNYTLHECFALNVNVAVK